MPPPAVWYNRPMTRVQQHYSNSAAAPQSPVAAGQIRPPDALLRLLQRCAPDSGQDAATLYLTPAALAVLDTDKREQIQPWRQFLAAAELLPGGAALRQADTGLALFRSGGQGFAVIPPFPITDRLAGPEPRPSWDTGPLAQLLAADYTVGVILLRLGRYLVAVFEGDRPAVSKTDARYVKGKHHAGGTSQLRFQRIREGQARKLYDETCRVVRERFAPYENRLDYVLLGGDQQTLNAFIKVCPQVRQYQAQGKLLNRRLNIREPKHATLEQIPGLLRQSRVWQLGGPLPAAGSFPDDPFRAAD